MVEKHHCSNPAAGSPASNAYCLNNSQYTLKEEDEKEGHKVEGAVSPEGFVQWSEPAGVTAWAEQEQPKQRKAKVCGTSTSSPPRNTRNDIDAKCG